MSGLEGTARDSAGRKAPVKRARKRGPRIAVAFAVGVLVVSAAAGGLLWWRFGLLPPGDEVRVFNEHARSLRPEGEPGWPAFRALLVGEFDFDDDSPTPMKSERTAAFRDAAESARRAQRGSLDDPRVAAHLAKMSGYTRLLPELDAIADMPVFGYDLRASEDDTTVNGALNNVLIGVTLPLSRFGSINNAQMRLDASKGDWAAVERRMTTGVGLARHMGEPPLGVTRSIGHSNESLAWQSLARALADHPPPPDVARRLLAAAESLGEPAGLADAVRGELLGLHGLVNAHVASKRHDLDLFDLDSLESWIESPCARVLAKRWRRFWRDAEPVIDLPPPERDTRRPGPSPMPDILGQDMFTAMTTPRDLCLRDRAGALILLHLCARAAELPATGNPLALLPESLRLDPVTGEPISVEPTAHGRMPFTLLWPKVAREWFTRREVIPARAEYEEEPWEATEGAEE